MGSLLEVLPSYQARKMHLPFFFSGNERIVYLNAGDDII